MHLFYRLKGFANIAFVLFYMSNVYSQSVDTLKYTSYKNQPIFYLDIGYNAAPSSIKYPFTNEIDKIKFRHNFKTMLGFGFSYKWFSVRLGAALVGDVRPVSRYGKANYIDLGINFSIKKTYSEIDFRNYTGYVIKDARNWDTTFHDLRPNDTEQLIGSYNIAFSMWYFDNKNFKMDPFNGIKGRYNKPVTTWYLAGRFDVYGLNDQVGSIVPSQLIDTTNTKTGASGLNAVDIGVIPGVGHSNRHKKFQYGAMLAFGPRIQSKTYTVNGQNTNLLGIVLRYDIKLVAGYNVPKFFALLSVDFDNKSIAFNDFKYQQSFYRMRLSVGWRFNTKKSVISN